MFRILALTIVLTLAAGPSAMLLCRGWCDDTAGVQAAAVDRCHHHASSGAAASLAANDACKNLPGVTVFVREDMRRTTSGSDGHAAVIVPRYRFTASTSDNASLHHPQPDGSVDKRPLTTVLRI